MKILLTTVLWLSVASISNAQQSDGYLTTGINAAGGLRIEAGQRYQQTFPVTAEKKTTLEIKVRNRRSMGQLAKMALPFLATTTYGLLRQHGSQDGAEKQGVPSAAAYVAGGLLVSGVPMVFTSRRTKAYVTLEYRDKSNVLVHKEGQWIDTRKTVSISMRSPVDGWVDVSLEAPMHHGIRVLQLDFKASDDSMVVPMGGNPCQDPNGDCNPDNPDYGENGIVGGSGSMNDPFLLAEVTIIGQGSGTTTTIDVNFYYYTGGYYYDNYYPEGNYSTDYYDSWINSGSYDSGTTITGSSDNMNDIERVDGECDGLKRMLALQKQHNRETAAFVTIDGKVFILPMKDNTETSAQTANQYQDSQGRTVMTVFEENGDWHIEIYDWNTSPATVNSYPLAYHIHSHPMNGNQNSVSNDDKDFAASPNFSGLPKYILNMRKIIEYDHNGEVGRTNLKSECPNP